MPKSTHHETLVAFAEYHLPVVSGGSLLNWSRDGFGKAVRSILNESPVDGCIPDSFLVVPNQGSLVVAGEKFPTHDGVAGHVLLIESGDNHRDAKWYRLSQLWSALDYERWCMTMWHICKNSLAMNRVSDDRFSAYWLARLQTNVDGPVEQLVDDDLVDVGYIPEGRCSHGRVGFCLKCKRSSNGPVHGLRRAES